MPADAMDPMELVTIRWTGQEAEMVKLAGEFNNWQPEPMERDEGGGWSRSLKLSAGRYEYKFVLDDQWTVNTDLPTVEDGSGNRNNVVVVEESEGSGGDSDSWEKVSIPEEEAAAALTPAPADPMTMSTNLQKISLVERTYCIPGSYQDTLALIRSEGGEVKEEKESRVTYYDSSDHKLGRAGVWLRSLGEGEEQWEVSSLHNNLKSLQDSQRVNSVLQQHLGCSLSDLSQLVASADLHNVLELTVKSSTWLLGETRVEVMDSGSGLVSVRLEEAGDLVTAVSSLQTSAEKWKLTLYNANLAPLVS